MVKIFNTRQKLEYAWDHVTLAMFLKYPNPFSVHVISADVIDRYVDSFGRLCTTRLIHKKGSIPNWVQYWLKTGDAYVIEESIVDPSNGTMCIRSKNLSHQKILTIEERQIFTKDSNSIWTLIDTEAKFSCGFGWASLAHKLEQISLTRFKEHMIKSKQALSHVIEKIIHSNN